MNRNLIRAFEKQINLEFSSSYDFFIMSTEFRAIFMEIFSKRFERIAIQKINLAKKLCNYLILREEKFNFFSVDENHCAQKNVSDIFLRAEFQQKLLYGEMKKLSKLSAQVGDFRAYQFLEEIISKFYFCTSCKSNNLNKEAFEVCTHFDRA